MSDKNIYPCALLINDIHVSKDNIPEAKANWNEALQVCDERGIKLILVGGDLFQARSSQNLDILLAIYDMLAIADNRGIKIVLANGNHDKVNQEAIRGYCHVYGQFDNVAVVDDFLTITDDEWDCAIHMIAYFPESGSFTSKLNALITGGLDEERKNLLYIHEGINGALAHSSDNELPANIFGDFDKVFVGHYHNRCLVKGSNVEFIGSSRQHNFGEDEEKGYTLVFNDGSHEFVKNQANTRYQVIDVPANKVDIHLSDRLEEIREDGRYKVKVRVHSTNADAASIDKSKLLDSGAMKVEIITEEPEIREIVSSSLFEKFDNNKIQENYKEFCRVKDIEDPALGLSYLAKIDKNVEAK